MARLFLRASSFELQIIAILSSFSRALTARLSLESPEFFETCYHVATDTIKKAKMTKFQLCGCIVDITKDLQQIGFTRQDLSRVASLDIE